MYLDHWVSGDNPYTSNGLLSPSIGIAPFQCRDGTNPISFGVRRRLFPEKSAPK
jgi:hypothetical protein